MAQFRVALGLVLISLIACIVQAEQEQDGIKARGAKFGEVTVEVSKEACKARCKGVDTCEFWTWFYPTANSAFARRCSMYGGDINESRNNPNAISGSIGDNLDQLVNPAPAPAPIVDPAIAIAAAEAEAAAAAAAEAAAATALAEEAAAAEAEAAAAAALAEEAEAAAAAAVAAADAEALAAAEAAAAAAEAAAVAAAERAAEAEAAAAALAAANAEAAALAEAEAAAALAEAEAAVAAALAAEEQACPIGFHQIIEGSPHCYALFPGRDYEISHPEAQDSCEDLGANLVSFDTKAEFKAVIKYMKGDGGQKGWWWWTALVKNEAGNFNNNGCPAYKGKSFKKKKGTDCAYLKLKDEVMQAQMGKCREPRPFICETGGPSC